MAKKSKSVKKKTLTPEQREDSIKEIMAIMYEGGEIPEEIIVGLQGEKSELPPEEAKRRITLYIEKILTENEPELGELDEQGRKYVIPRVMEDLASEHPKSTDEIRKMVVKGLKKRGLEYYDSGRDQPLENVEQPAQAPGNLEKEVASGANVSIQPLADMGDEIDTYGIAWRAMNIQLSKGEYDLDDWTKSSLRAEISEAIKKRNPITKYEAERIAKEIAPMHLEQYKLMDENVEQPKMPKKRTAAEHAKVGKEKGFFKTAIITSAALIGLSMISAGISYSLLSSGKKGKENTAVVARDKKLSALEQTVIATDKKVETIGNEYQEGNKELKESVQNSEKTITSAITEQGNKTIEVIAEQGDKTAQAIKEGYTEIARNNQGNYEAVVTAIRETRKEDPEPIAPEPIAPEPTADELANNLLNEVKDEPGKQGSEVPEKPIPRTPNPYSLKVTPYACYKFALKAKDKPDPMPVFGLEVEVEKENGSVYLGIERGQMDESETNPIGYLDLKSASTTLRLGGRLSSSKERKFRTNVSLGLRVTREENEITGRAGTYDVDDSRNETILGVEAGVGLKYDCNDKVSLTGMFGVGHSIDKGNTNVTSDAKVGIGVQFKF